MWSLASVAEADFDALLAIRIAAMRESLERLGRFDPERARQRLRDNFIPANTQKIYVGDELIGFYALRENAQDCRLEHLYLLPQWQGRGIGSEVLSHLKQRCASKPISLGALRGSTANGFYLRHGFAVVGETEWDIDYIYRGISF